MTKHIFLRHISNSGGRVAAVVVVVVCHNFRCTSYVWLKCNLGVSVFVQPVVLDGLYKYNDILLHNGMNSLK
jgi:hypothetical protein